MDLVPRFFKTKKQSIMLTALIMMLHNTKDNKWHPIVYFESPVPGPYDINNPIRYKSKMHHTTGFDDREAALGSIDNLEERLKTQDSQTIFKECETDIEWDGEGMPIDHQIRPGSYILNTV
jgi:hypothetical protein